jgi:hypothetical protein
MLHIQATTLCAAMLLRCTFDRCLFVSQCGPVMHAWLRLCSCCKPKFANVHCADCHGVVAVLKLAYLLNSSRVGYLQKDACM